MEPYDDDDAMINDYIEEDFDEPPDEFDEDAFFEHAVATANECSTDVTAQPLFEAPMIDPEVGKDENISMDESSVQSASVREAFARGRNQADIFSFDR